jgi:hypothetical protein
MVGNPPMNSAAKINPISPYIDPRKGETIGNLSVKFCNMKPSRITSVMSSRPMIEYTEPNSSP